MYVPQFTTRNLLLMVAGAGLIFFFINRAVEGHAWAVGISVGFLSLLVLLGCSAVLFFLAWSVRLMMPKPTMEAQNPFITDRPPEQIIEPVNPD